MPKGKDLKAILKLAKAKAPTTDTVARRFYESGLEKGYQIGFADGIEEGKRIGHGEGMKVWAAMQVENEKAAKKAAKPETTKLPNGDVLIAF